MAPLPLFLISLGIILLLCYFGSKECPLGWLIVGIFLLFAGLGLKASEFVK